MKTGSVNRSNYKRTSGSKNPRKYIGKSAKKIRRMSPETQKEATVRYNDYYDFPPKKDKSSGPKTLTAVIVSLVILSVLAAIVTGLALMKPKNTHPTSLVTASPIATKEEDTPVTVMSSGSEAPVIYGINPIVVYTGMPVAYKDGVYVKDDKDPDPVLEIDNEEVDLSTPGTYVVTYIATDSDHNETRALNTVTVMAGSDLVSDDEIYALADQVLKTVIPDDTISDEMKCLKVYEYLHAIGYVDEVHSEDWMQNAYYMLSKRGGDCFCYYSASRLLLSRLGYEVMEVRNNNNYVHYWCLVSIDGGETWWHFDPCCWSWGEDGILCLVSDNYLQEFTRRHYTSDGRLIHAWDLTKYPATPAEDFWTDEDRAVIYESGLIDVDATYDESLWSNDGWDNYEIPYSYSIPEVYYDDYAVYEDLYAGYAEDVSDPVWEEPGIETAAEDTETVPEPPAENPGPDQEGEYEEMAEPAPEILE